MKLVIEIPEEQYLLIRHYQDIAPNKTHSLAMAIINGTPLPKGHGRLVDIDLLQEQLNQDKREAFSHHQVWLLLSTHNKQIPTIIEADKAESDEQEKVDDYRDRLDELEREEYYESKYGKEQE